MGSDLSQNGLFREVKGPKHSKPREGAATWACHSPKPCWLSAFHAMDQGGGFGGAHQN